MKNNNDQQYEIRKARATRLQRVTTDILVNPVVVERNMAALAQNPPRPRQRRHNYAKKIANNPFIMNA